jgi:hypothetical protein
VSVIIESCACSPSTRAVNTNAIYAAPTEFLELPSEEQDDHVSICEYAGMLEREHPSRSTA